MPRLIYLDNASTSWPKPPEVAEAMARFLREGAASPGRGGYAMAAKNAETLARVRSKIAAMIGSRDSERVVLTPGATDALNMAILGLFAWRGPAPLERRPHVVATVLEHSAVRRPLHRLKVQGYIDVTEVPCDAHGLLHAEEIVAAVQDRTSLVAVMSASNAVGTVSPAAEVCRTLRVRRPDILTLVDASQTAGLMPLHIEKDCIDLAAFPGHKALLGPTGTGFLYVSPRSTGEAPGATARLEPVRFGGTGGDAGSEEMPAGIPKSLEPGTFNAVGFVGVLAALDAAGRPSSEVVLAHERRLIARAIQGLSGVKGVRIVGTTDPALRTGALPIVVDGWASADLSAALDSRYGICVRAGLHCAPAAHRAMGTFEGGGAARMSVGVYNTDEDVDAFVNAIREAAAAA